MMEHVESQSASHTKPYCYCSQPQRDYESQAPGLGSPVPKNDVAVPSMLQGYWSYPLFRTYIKQILKSYNTQHALASGSPLTSSPTILSLPCSLWLQPPWFSVTPALSLIKVCLCICLLFPFLEISSSRNLHGVAFHFRPMLKCQSLKKPSPLYSQQKQDQELTAAQIMNSLLPKSDWNWRK